MESTFPRKRRKIEIKTSDSNSKTKIKEIIILDHLHHHQYLQE